MSKENTKKDEKQPRSQVNVQKEIALFRESLKGKNEADLKKLEEELIKEIDEHQKFISEAELPMPSKNRVEAMEAIRALLGKQSVTWQFALAMNSLYEFFDPGKKHEKVSFPILDAMLRNLSQQDYKGYEEWSKCAIVNNYFEPIRDQYVSISEKTYTLAEKHVAIQEQLQLFKQTPQVDHGVVKPN